MRNAWAVQRERVVHLERALERRVRIEQAKGFVSARSPLTPESAFDALRRHARRTSRPLGGVVDDVLEERLPVDDVITPAGRDPR
jgi:AmiR/NasT family two-component response regulator